MGVPLPIRLRGSSLPVAWILIFCGGCSQGCQCSLGSYFQTGHKGGQGAPVLSPKALPPALAQAPPPAMGIFLLARRCWVTSEHEVWVSWRPKHIRVQDREVVSVETGISTALCFSEHLQECEEEQPLCWRAEPPPGRSSWSPALAFLPGIQALGWWKQQKPLVGSVLVL